MLVYQWSCIFPPNTYIFCLLDAEDGWIWGMEKQEDEAVLYQEKTHAKSKTRNKIYV